MCDFFCLFDMFLFTGEACRRKYGQFYLGLLYTSEAQLIMALTFYVYFVFHFNHFKINCFIKYIV